MTDIRRKLDVNVGSKRKASDVRKVFVLAGDFTLKIDDFIDLRRAFYRFDKKLPFGEVAVNGIGGSSRVRVFF